MNQEGNKSAARDSLRLLEGDAGPCPYLKDREAVQEFAPLTHLDGATYHRLMDRGFRRSGHAVFRPACRGCRECRPIRVPISRFSPSRSQRRVLRRNLDVRVQIDAPVCTEEKWRIFSDYLSFQHDGAMDGSFPAFRDFLYRSPTDTVEMTYHVGPRLVAAGIVDVCPDCLSSVYFYFDPAHAKRSLGVFGALREIEECRARGLSHWYAGYTVRQCRSMNYKENFRPHELLGTDGTWRPAGDKP